MCMNQDICALLGRKHLTHKLVGILLLRLLPCDWLSECLLPAGVSAFIQERSSVGPSASQGVQPREGLCSQMWFW